MKNIKLFLLGCLVVMTSLYTSAQNGLHFDRVNDYVQTTYGGVLGTTARTFEAWVYVDVSAPAANLCIVDYGLNAVGSRNTFVVRGNRGIMFLSGGTNANIGSTSSNLVPDTTWTHVAFVLNAGTGYLYVNGVQVGTGNLSTVNTPSTGVDVRIGQRVAGGTILMGGRIDEVRIWSVARTPAEIMANMNSELCGTHTGLAAYYKLNEGVAGGTNTTVTTATNEVAAANGSLLNFSLTGATSNWVTGQTLGAGVARNNQTFNECAGFSIAVVSNTYNTTGVYSDTIVAGSASGCDSIITTNLTVAPQAINNQTLNECAGFSITIGSNTYTTTGMYADTLVAGSVQGCDSIINTNLTVAHQAINTLILNECAGFSITVGSNIYDTTGIYVDTLFAGSALGCDSIVNINLTVAPQAINNQTFNECAGFSVTVGFNTYTTTGMYSDILVAAAANGCDSIVNTNLTINFEARSTQTLSECAGYSITVGGNTYNTTGIYMDTLFAGAANGCDSIITTDLTIAPPIVGTQTFNECAGFSITVGSNTYTTTGMYSDTLFAGTANGCDSVIITDLTIAPTIDPTVSTAFLKLTANQAGASYQWLDCNANFAIIPSPGSTNQAYIPAINGNYAVEITLNNCIDTSACHAIMNVGINELTQNAISIYPNPTTNKINVDLGHHVDALNYSLISITGKVIRENEVTNVDAIYIDMGAEAKGIYFLRLNNIIVKVIKK